MTSLPGDHISFFSGVGMTDYAVDARGFRTIATAEIDPWNRTVLAARLPNAKHFDDVRKVTSNAIGRTERPLIITGGFPCQDVNSSGTGLGLEGERSGLVREMLRGIKEFRPEYALFENSSLLTKRGLSYIITELASMGYHVRWECLPAAIVDAPHLRDRCYVMARLTPFEVPSDATEIGDFNAYAVPDELPRSGVTFYEQLFETNPLVTRRTARLNAEAIHGKLMPTPTKSDGSGGPGTTPKRTGGKNLRTVVAEEEGSGRLNPAYVEWMMGLPLGWTDPYVPNHKLGQPLSWRESFPFLKTVANRAVPDRGRRIQALGNGLVPQVATLALDLLLQD